MPRPTLDDAPMSGVFEEERVHPDGRRSIQLNRRERQAIERTHKCEAAAALFLDLQEKHTWKSISEELGISISALKDLTKSAEFEEVYNQLYADISHDPRYKAVQGAIADMLPLATVKLRKLLESERTPATVALNAIKTVYEFAGITPPNEVQSERRALAEFLAQKNLQPGTPVDVPDNYEEAMERYGVHVIDGSLQEPPPDEQSPEAPDEE